MLARTKMFTTAGCIYVLLILVTQTLTQQHGPGNITRSENEKQVFIPCPYASRYFAPSIWRINGTEYTSATLPPIFSLGSNGLYIDEVHKCLDQTSFQCIDTSESGLQWQESSIGTLSVKLTSVGCTRSELESFLQRLNLELNHQQIVYTEKYTTLAWKIIPSNCSISQIESYAPCQQTNAHFNITTNETKITLPLENFSDQVSGELVDFSISSIGDQPLDDCPRLLDTVRFNVSKTETVNLLLGNNDCTCVEMDCQGALNVAISNPDPNEVDLICPVYGDMCYSPEICHGFNGVPFFNICETSMSENLICKLNLCFKNVSEAFNNSRLDFFVSEKVICMDTTVYTARTYIRSFEIRVAAAIADISVNASSGKICFHSAEDCYLTNLTQYNVSITNFDGVIIFSEEGIPEANCVIISELLSPDHAPLLISAQPINDYIEYRPISRAVISDQIVLRLINDSPRVNGSTITADIYYNQPIRHLRCALSRLPLQDCSSGSVTFKNVPPRGETNVPYSLRVVAVNADGLRTVTRTSVRPEETGFCLAHFINDGVQLSGNTATFEFIGVGDFETFQCNLDREGFKPCSSPQVYTGLSPGQHRLKVVPHIRECGRRRRSIVINFIVH